MSKRSLLFIIVTGLLAACNDGTSERTQQQPEDTAVNQDAGRPAASDTAGVASGDGGSDDSRAPHQERTSHPEPPETTASTGYKDPGTDPTKADLQIGSNPAHAGKNPSTQHPTGSSGSGAVDALVQRRFSAETEGPAYQPNKRVEQPARDGENYATHGANPVKYAPTSPISTFSVDVDTGSYANIRRMLENGTQPPSGAVRVEELINYFDYDYPLPERGSAPFSVTTRVAETPWNQDTRLLEVGLQGWEPKREAMPANLVFLVDVSGSMESARKLPLLRTALKLLVDNLDHRDRVAIVTYAGQARTVLEPTPGDRDGRIKRVIDRLRANGSTNGGAGIRRAYELAERAYRDEGINRVLLASDGDFNAGTVDFEALIDLVEERREAGIALTTLGFGSGNYNDRLVEQLANNGDGNHAYIDSLSEAHRVLVANYAANMQTIAEDVKIQIEFNPSVVSQYRLIGYRNRDLAREDFRDDAVDAGEIGAGHTVTALYEIAPHGTEPGWREPPRYQGASAHRRPVPPDMSEMAFLKLRYKRPGAEKSRLIEQPIQRSEPQPLTQADEDLRFATAVAGFGQLLQGGKHIDGFGYQAVQQLARGARGDDPHGRHSEFLELVELANALEETGGGHRRYSQQGTH